MLGLSADHIPGVGISADKGVGMLGSRSRSSMYSTTCCESISVAS